MKQHATGEPDLVQTFARAPAAGLDTPPRRKVRAKALPGPAKRLNGSSSGYDDPEGDSRLGNLRRIISEVDR